MKPLQLEILLFTNTHFSSLLLFEKNDPNQKKSAEYNDLEEACWNGFFKESLPELYDGVEDNKKMTLWEVTAAQHFLELDYGEYPQLKDPLLSINPYCFLTEVSLS
jgi:hypothetical protein